MHFKHRKYDNKCVRYMASLHQLLCFKMSFSRPGMHVQGSDVRITYKLEFFFCVCFCINNVYWCAVFNLRVFLRWTSTISISTHPTSWFTVYQMFLKGLLWLLCCRLIWTYTGHRCLGLVIDMDEKLKVLITDL